MRPPIVVLSPGLRVYPSSAAAERALLPGSVGSLDAFDAAARPLRIAERRGLLGLLGRRGPCLVAGATSAAARRALRDRLAEELVRAGAPRPWAEGAPLGALLAEAARRWPA